MKVKSESIVCNGYMPQNVNMIKLFLIGIIRKICKRSVLSLSSNHIHRVNISLKCFIHNARPSK